MHYVGCDLYILLTLCPRLASLGAPPDVHPSTQQGLHSPSTAGSTELCTEQSPFGQPQTLRSQLCSVIPLLRAPNQPLSICTLLHDGYCDASTAPAPLSPPPPAGPVCGLWGWEVVCSSTQPRRAAPPLPCEVITSRNDKLLTNYTISLRPDATNEISVSCFQLIPLLRK